MRDIFLWIRFALIIIVSIGIFADAQAKRKRPNIILIISDDLNTHLGSYGKRQVKTPHIDSLARGGRAFSHAYAQYPVCGPSRASFLTGLYPPQTGVLINGTPFREYIPNAWTLPQLLRKEGYHTARTGKVFHYKVPKDIGTSGDDDPPSWDEVRNPKGIDRDDAILEQAERIVEGRKTGLTLSWMSTGKDSEHTDYKLADAAIELMQKNHPQKTGKPLFLSVGFFRPHTPFIAPKKYFDLYPLSEIEPPLTPEGDRDDIPPIALGDRIGQVEMSRLHKKKAIQGYYASVSFMDAQLGRILKAVKELGLEEDSIIIFTSDHGFHLGQHELWQKGDLFEGSLHLPLIIKVPGMKRKGEAAKGVVELLDLYPTILEMARIKIPRQSQGKSLLPLLSDPHAEIRKASFSMALGRAGRVHREWAWRHIMGYSIRTGRYRYTEYGENGEWGQELYDYEQDPNEYENRAKEKYAPIWARMRHLLHQRKADAKREVKGL